MIDDRSILLNDVMDAGFVLGDIFLCVFFINKALLFCYGVGNFFQQKGGWAYI